MQFYRREILIAVTCCNVLIALMQAVSSLLVGSAGSVLVRLRSVRISDSGWRLTVGARRLAQHATHAGDGADAADAEDWAVQCQQCCIEKEKALDEAETKKKLVP